MRIYVAEYLKFHLDVETESFLTSQYLAKHPLLVDFASVRPMIKEIKQIRKMTRITKSDTEI